ncbi:hypothetical protein [Roseibium sp.]|uniref:hypothetical protein n=1 Tax=Roseibium sp. TaxID=1936156 RepID=UPI003A96D18B
MPPRASLKQRRAKKAERQRNYRQRQKEARRPSRNDIATTTFHMIVQETARVGNWSTFNKMLDLVTARLVERGFDKVATEKAIDDLVEKYENGWEFQRKPDFKDDSEA